MLTVEDTYVTLDSTTGLSEVIHPFKGGDHEFRYEEDDNGEPQIFFDFDGTTFNLDREAYVSALKKIPGGSDALGKWPLWLSLTPLNHFFDNNAGEFRVLLQHDQIVSFSKPTAILFRPTQVLDMMIDAVTKHSGHTADDVQVDDLVHSVELTTFTVLDPEGPGFIDARPGDRTLAALGFHGSLLGLSPMELTARTRRVVCSNGMVSATGVSKFRIGNEEEDSEGGIARLEEWLRTETEGLYNGEAMAEELARIQHLTVHNVPREDEYRTLEDLWTRHGVSAAARGEIVDALEVERDGTMYGVVQAFTRAAQHSTTLTEGLRERLMRDAGEIVFNAREICDTCHRIMA